MLNEKQTRVLCGELLGDSICSNSLKNAYCLSMQALGVARVLTDQELVDQIITHLQSLREKFRAQTKHEAEKLLTDRRGG